MPSPYWEDQSFSSFHEDSWPDGLFPTEDKKSEFSFWVVFLDALRKAWSEDFDEYDSEEAVGDVDQEEIKRVVTIYARTVAA